MDTNGNVNAAPFSFFNAFGGDPPVVGVGIGSHKPPQAKDTRENIRETGEFVVNLVSEDLAKAMNITAIEFDRGVNELEKSGLTTLASTHVRPPRIAKSPVQAHADCGTWSEQRPRARSRRCHARSR
jgi:flavin reductase (DIM6/NTAB) family NADH-FMN oxidoreductase RutF